MSAPDEEVAFLILHHLRSLSAGPAVAAATADLEAALGVANLLPVEHDYTGAARTLSYEETAARLPHIPPTYLSAALSERLPPAQPPARLPTHTLFDRGACSTVPADVRVADLPAPRAAPRPRAPTVRALLERMRTTDAPIPISPLTNCLLPRSMRRLKRLVGHTDVVYCAVYDFSSRYIVTGSDDHRLKVWCARTGSLHRTLRGHDDVIVEVVAVPDRRAVVSASADNTIRVWDVVTGENTHVLRSEHISDLTVLAFSPCPDRPYLLVGDNAAEAFLWNAEDYAKGPVRIPFPVMQRRQVASSTVGTPGANTSGTRAVADSGVAGAPTTQPPIVRGMMPGMMPAAASSHAVQAVQQPNAGPAALTPGGGTVQPGAAGAQAAPSPRPQGTLSNAANSIASATPTLQVLAVAFNAGATRLAFSGSDCLVHVYAVERGESYGDLPSVRFLASLRGHTGGISQVAFSRNSDRICTASKDGTARVWRRVCTRIPKKKRREPLEGTGSWKSIVLDCKKNRGDVRSSWSLGASVTPSTSITPRVPAWSALQRENSEVDCVLWSLTDKFIVTSSANKLRVWDAETGRVKHVLLEHSDKIYVIESHPFVKSIVLTAGYDGKCVLWDIEKGTLLKKFMVTNSRIPRILEVANVPCGDPANIKNGKFSPDGHSFCVTDNCGAVTIFGADSRASMAAAPEQQFFSSEFVTYNKDAMLRAVCRDTGKLLHLVERGDLCDKLNTRHPPRMQSNRHVEPAKGDKDPEEDVILPEDNETVGQPREALISRAEEFRKSEKKEEKRLVKTAKAKHRREVKERRKAELERDIMPMSPMRDFLVSDYQEIDEDYVAGEEDLNGAADSASSDDNPPPMDDDGEYSPLHRLIRNDSASRRPRTRSMDREVECTCGAEEAEGKNRFNLDAEKDTDSSEDDASFRMSVDNESDFSSEADDSLPEGPASPPARNRTNLGRPGPALPRMTIHLSREGGQGGKNAPGGETRPSPLNRSFTSERRAENNNKSSPEKSVDVEMHPAVEPRQTSRDSITTKDAQNGEDTRMQWSVQSAAENKTESKGQSNSGGKRRGRPSGSRNKEDSDSDFDPSEFYNREEEDVDLKGGNASRKLGEKSRRGRKRNRRKTRSRVQKSTCPVFGRPSCKTSYPESTRLRSSDRVAASITGNVAEESDDSGSEIIRRKRRRRVQESKPDNKAVGGTKGGVEDARKMQTDPLSASQWLRATSARYMYVPQRGDIVYYFARGHTQAMAHWKERGFNPLGMSAKGEIIPDKFRLDGSKLNGRVEPLRFAISGISYGFPSPAVKGSKEDKKRTRRSSANANEDAARTVALLTLRREHAGAWPRGVPNEVTLAYYPVDDVPEYMVLASRVHTSLARNWRIGDKFQMLFVNDKRVWEYYTGQVRHVSSETSAMGWSSLRVEFNEEEDPEKKVMDKLSPWELEPLNDTKKLLRPPSGNGLTTPTVDGLRDDSGLFLAIAKEIDMLQAQDVTFKSHMSWLHTFGTQCNSAEYCKLVPFPISIELVQTRLCTGFYRHFESFVNDIELLKSNAVLFKGRDSDEAKLVGSVYAVLLSLGGKARQRLAVAGRDAKAAQNVNVTPHTLPTLGAIVSGRVPYAPCAPRIHGAPSASGNVMPGGVAAPSRNAAAFRNPSLAMGLHSAGGHAPVVNALPPVVPAALVPPRATSRRSVGRPSSGARAQSSPVHRGRSTGSGAATSTLAPGLFVPVAASTGAGMSAPQLGIPPAMLMHPGARMMPPVQVPFAPRSATVSNPGAASSFPTTRSNAPPARGGMGAAGPSLSALLAPAATASGASGSMYPLHEPGMSTLAGVNGVYAGYGLGRQGRAPDGGTQSCGGSMEAAGGGGMRAGGGGGHTTSESRIPGWPQHAAYSPAASVPGRLGGGVAANSAGTGRSPHGIYHQEHSSISVAAAESTMSCGGENGPAGAATGESTERGAQQ